MDTHEAKPSHLPAPFAALLLTLALGLGAAAHVGFLAWIGLDADDTENLESTLVLLASRQLTDGFGGLYGPYDGENPGVLIQAPLYYRLTGVLAAPLFRLGLDPVDACRVTGRLISMASLVGLLWLVGAMARMWGGSWRAGLWAVMLLAGSTAIGAFPVSLRADLLGVFLQSLGLYGTLRVLSGDRKHLMAILLGTYAAFALALCTKQHYLAGPTFATVTLGIEAALGRVSWRALIAAHAVALTLVVGYLGVENAVTGGMMLRSTFLLPMELKAITPGSWPYVGLVFLTTAKNAFGLLAVAIACLAATSRNSRGGRLETLLLAFIALDLILMAKLCLNSSGGWYNYAIEAAACGAVLIGRALCRIVEAAERPSWRWGLVGLAALVLLASDARRVANSVAFRRSNRAVAVALLNDPVVAETLPEQRYFPGSIQHYNVRYGDRRFLHDEWLYGAFEAIGAAEPRTEWLGRAFDSGRVRLVVMPDESIEPQGLGRPLPELGFVRAGRVGSFHLWSRELNTPLLTRLPSP